jgi:hypothetical protein
LNVKMGDWVAKDDSGRITTCPATLFDKYYTEENWIAGFNTKEST